MGKDKAPKRSRGSLVQDIVQSDTVKRKNRPAKERLRQSDNVDQVSDTFVNSVAIHLAVVTS